MIRGLGREADGVARDEPAALRHRDLFAFGSARVERTDPPPQEWWREQRGDEDHRDQRAVLVLAQYVVGQADAGEDEADLAAGEHPEADQEPVPDAAEQAHAGDELAEAGHDAEHRDEGEEVGVGERVEVGLDADLEEEDRDEQVADRGELPPDARGRRGATQGDAGRERTHDRGEVRGVGEQGEHQREREGDRHERARRPGPPVDELEDLRTELRPDADREDEERHRDHDDLHDVDHVDGPRGGDPHDDRQQHQAHHVVGHRGAENRAPLDAGQRPQVAEHPGGDAHARGGKRGAEEQGHVARLAEHEPGEDAEDNRDDDADRRDQQRGLPDRPQLRETELEPDLEEQQDHAELGEDGEHLVGLEQAEDRRPHDDAGDDLADHRGHADALGDLRRDLRRQEDDDDVDEDAGDAQRLRAEDHGTAVTAASSAVTRCIR